MTKRQFYQAIKKGATGKFRRVRVGEAIEETDLIVEADYYDYVAPMNVGQLANNRDVILRFEVEVES